ncbi:MAG: ShlB/FhaC/HecB family hemolysin secretion/activation protein, partial [Belnapia sp.]|nr:ShlB/FhaC/HecB family hemolysin secretion/activation protein [Belnapia sp.]
MRLFRLAFGAATALSVLGAGPVRAQAPPPAPTPTQAPVPRPTLEPSQRNPIELNRPVVPPRLSPSLEGPPIAAQTGPGSVAEITLGTVRISGAEAVSPAALAPAIAGLADTRVSLARIEEARLAILRGYR